MDSLSVLLKEIRVQGSVHFNACFHQKWGLNVERNVIGSFHLIVTGECWLAIKGTDKPIKVQSGDALILPHGTEHQLYDSSPSDCISGVKVINDIKNGTNPFEGDDAGFNIACGYFEFERNFKHTFVESLPQLIHITHERRQRYEWLDRAIQLLVSESASDMPGKTCFIDRVTELFFIQIIRVHMNENKGKKNYFAALGDKHLTKAIQVMHEYPDRPWTLESLAKHSGMSRTRFAAKFKSLVGMTAMRYLTTCRMIQAKRFIESSDMSLSIVAEKVGYQSESAFKSAFKNFYGQTPASFRDLAN